MKAANDHFKTEREKISLTSRDVFLFCYWLVFQFILWLFCLWLRKCCSQQSQQYSLFNAMNLLQWLLLSSISRVCVILYLVTGWLCNTAEAGATHLSQRRPVAKSLVHGVNNAVICLCTTRGKVDQSHIQLFQKLFKSPACSNYSSESSSVFGSVLFCSRGSKYFLKTPF